MKLFKDRLNMGEHMNKIKDQIVIDYTALALLDPLDVQLSINTDRLRSFNIPVPQEGQLLDIVYVNQGFGVKKTSQKMCLLPYAVAQSIPIDKIEYINMFKTTGSRIIVCCCYTARNCKNDDEADKLAMKTAKELFNKFDI